MALNTVKDCGNLQNTFGFTPDQNVAYTGSDIVLNNIFIRQGATLRYVLDAIFSILEDNSLVLISIEEELQNINTIISSIPIYVVDVDIDFETTSSYLNLNYGSIPNGSVVYNKDTNTKFTKFPTGWEYSFLDLR